MDNAYYVSVKLTDRLKKDKMVRGFHYDHEPTTAELEVLRLGMKESFNRVTRKRADSIEISVTPNDPNTEESYVS